MSRRAVPSRRLSDGGSIPLVGSLQQKAKASPFLSVSLVVVGALLLIGYSYSSSGGFGSNKEISHLGEGASCAAEVQRAIPILKKTYGDSLQKVLHVGPESCAVVSRLLKEDIEAWGVEPYDLEDADSGCKSLVRKGIVRVADIKFPLPYRPKSFSLVIVSDALDYLSPKYLNKTLPDLARVSADGLIVFAGFPGQQRAKLPELAKFGRPAGIPFFHKCDYELNTYCHDQNGGQPPVGVLQFDGSPSASYMRLPGESGRFRLPEIQLFASSSPPLSPAPGKQSALYQSYQQQAA